MKNIVGPLLLSVCAASVSAQSIDEIVQLEVLPGWRDAAGQHTAGLRIRLDDGWKTYWRAPGDGGIPPQLAVAGSDNLADIKIAWPVPEVFFQSGLRSIGYQSTVVIPLQIRTEQADQPIELTGTIGIGVCQEICIPIQFPISATLPPSSVRDGSIVAALMDRPLSRDEAGVQQATCAIKPGDGSTELTTRIKMPGLRGDEQVVIETGDPSVWVSEPDVVVSSNSIEAVSDLVQASGGGVAVDRSRVRITILGADRAVDVYGCEAG